MQLGHLVLRQRLGRKEIERATRRIAQDRIEHRQVVAERLARRRRRRDDDVVSRRHVGKGFGLMAVELRDPAAFECGLQSRIDGVSGKGANRASTAGSRRTAVTTPSGVSGALDPRTWRELFERALKRQLFAFVAADRGKAHGWSCYTINGRKRRSGAIMSLTNPTYLAVYRGLTARAIDRQDAVGRLSARPAQSTSTTPSCRSRTSRKVPVHEE